MFTIQNQAITSSTHHPKPGNHFIYSPPKTRQSIYLLTIQSQAFTLSTHQTRLNNNYIRPGHAITLLWQILLIIKLSKVPIFVMAGYGWYMIAGADPGFSGGVVQHISAAGKNGGGRKWLCGGKYGSWGVCTDAPSPHQCIVTMIRL